MFCEKCGTPNDNGVKFCKSCGHKMGIDIAASEDKTVFIGSVPPKTMQQVVQNPYEQPNMNYNPYNSNKTTSTQKRSIVPILLLIVSFSLFVGGLTAFFVLSKKSSENTWDMDRKSVSSDRAVGSSTQSNIREEIADFSYESMVKILNSVAENRGVFGLDELFVSSERCNSFYNSLREMITESSFASENIDLTTKELSMYNISISVEPNGKDVYKVLFFSNDGKFDLELDVENNGGEYKIK